MGTKAEITTEFTDDGFAIIRMLNGQNRLNLGFTSEFNLALDKVLSNTKCKALITTSEGKFYSNGIDLDWLMVQPREIAEKFSRSLIDLCWRLMHFPIPTVAALNGHTFAGGAFIAMSHDYRVMRVDRGWISWNETHLKLPIGDPLFEILNTKVLNNDAKREAVVFGRRVTAPEAKTLGLVDLAVELDKILPEAKRLARNALGNTEIDRDALAMMKRDVYVSTKVLNNDAKREAVVFGRRVTAPEAKTLGLVDLAVELDKILPEAKRLARNALGNTEIDRDALAMMKRDVYVRRLQSSKL